MGSLQANRTGWRALAPLLALLAAGPQPAHAQSAAAVLATHPKPVVDQLMRERIVILAGGPSSNGHGAMMTALVVFEQPRSKALLLLSQTSRQGEYRPELEEVETVERGEGTALDEHRMKIMFTQIDYRVRTRYDFERSRISWKIDPEYENDLQDLEGYWELYELDENRTLGRFGTRVSLGPAMPGWLQEYATRKNLPTTMERMRRWVNSNGKYRP